MSRFWKVSGTVMVVGLVAMVSAGAAFAQGKGQGTPTGDEGLGIRRQVERTAGGYGFFAVDQESMHAMLADALGISQETLEEAFEQGKTLSTLAETYNVDFETLLAVMEDAHEQALAEAFAAGDLTQQQAEWMLERASVRGVGRMTTANRGNRGPAFMPGAGDCRSE